MPHGRTDRVTHAKSDVLLGRMTVAPSEAPFVALVQANAQLTLRYPLMWGCSVTLSAGSRTHVEPAEIVYAGVYCVEMVAHWVPVQRWIAYEPATF